MTLHAIVRTRLLETVDIHSSELIVALFSGSNRHVNTHCATSGSPQKRNAKGDCTTRDISSKIVDNQYKKESTK